jgi:hypothetical protein
MVFDQIEQLKREYTDKYVVVDDSRPELARFRGVTGVVKTVNMSGRALVEFDNYLSNIGWYDIELDFLHVVPKPEPGAVAAQGEKPAVAKAIPGKTAPAKTVPVKAAAAKPVAAKPAAPAKASTADVLAALRAGKPAAKAAMPAPAVEPEQESEEEETTPEPHSVVEGEVPESITPTEEPPAAIPAKGAGKPGAAKGAAGALDAGKLGSKTLKRPADQIAYCRQVDTKS